MFSNLHNSQPLEPDEFVLEPGKAGVELAGIVSFNKFKFGSRARELPTRKPCACLADQDFDGLSRAALSPDESSCSRRKLLPI